MNLNQDDFIILDALVSKYWHFPRGIRPLHVCRFGPLFFTHVMQRFGFLTVVRLLCVLPLSFRTCLFLPKVAGGANAEGTSPMVEV